MSLARAFTTIGKRAKMLDEDFSMPNFMNRSTSQRGLPSRTVLRTEISAPLALVSTSNQQVRSARRIAGTAAIEIQQINSATSSDTSGSDDDSSVVGGPVDPDAHTDASSVDEAPEPNHLSCYFTPALNTAHKRSRASTMGSPTLSHSGSVDDNTIPSLPQRVPSHSKKAHERLHRTRSVQRILKPVTSFPLRAGLSRSNSDNNFTLPQLDFVEAPARDEPFGAELAQLAEVAEEFGQVSSLQWAEMDADMLALEARGLAHFSAHDYQCEIQGLVYETFGVAPHSRTQVVEWL